MNSKENEHLEIIREALGPYGFSGLTTLALRFFLRNAYESLVITDREGRIKFMDYGSEKLFGLPKGGAFEFKITDLLPDSFLPRVIETGYASIGRVLNVKGVKKISSSYPLIKDGEVIGAIGRVLFHSLEEAERINEELKKLRREVRSLRQKEQNEYSAVYKFENIMGQSSAIKSCIKMGKKIAIVNADVLISGESGTGKELLAQAIHNFRGSENPFVRINCPAIPFELAESELFGYEKGAFSGADRAGKKGKFETAEGGTIFLDEINSLPLSIQAKLLRVLQEREVEKVGGTIPKRVNFRVIAATNIDLKKAMKTGTFREDLYYRIARTAITIPPLRQRKEDIPIYVNHFLQAINKRFGTQFRGVSKDAIACLLENDWPGNVRDLINILEQACLKEWTGSELSISSFPEDINKGYYKANKALKKELNDQEKLKITEALKKSGGNKRKAASILGMPRSTFYNKLKKYKIVN